MSDYKPKDHRAITPYLMVADGAAVITFLRDALDAQERFLMRREDGKIAHASFRIDDSILELAEASDQWPAKPCALHVYVPDTDATYKKALAAGGTSLYEPADMFYGERSAGVKDPGGNSWFFATFQEEVPDDEVRRRAAAMEKKPAEKP